MAVDLTVRQGDTLPAFTATVTDQNDAAINLTGATVKFVMRQLANSAVTVDAAMSVTNAALGEVSYAWGATDTAVPGLYMAEIHVTESGGGTFTYPNVGYLAIEVEENLLLPSQQLVSVADVKDVLNMADADRVHDTKILRWIAAARPMIERLTGPIIPQIFEEWHDGGHYSITLWRRPSTAMGTSPILNVLGISEYNGPIEWPLAQIQSPDFGVLYSIETEITTGRIVRRTAGGGVQAFPNMPQSVHVWYQAGQSSVPANVYEGTLEYLRINYQATAQALRKAGGGRGSSGPEGPPVGYAMPNRVREILVPNRRFPAIG